jgi:hypothetical protein
MLRSEGWIMRFFVQSMLLLGLTGCSCSRDGPPQTLETNSVRTAAYATTLDGIVNVHNLRLILLPPGSPIRSSPLPLTLISQNGALFDPFFHPFQDSDFSGFVQRTLGTPLGQTRCEIDIYFQKDVIQHNPSEVFEVMDNFRIMLLKLQERQRLLVDIVFILQ